MSSDELKQAPRRQQIGQSGHLGVLVDEHEGVGHIVVAQVDHRGAHPAAQALLAPVQDAVHGA